MSGDQRLRLWPRLPLGGRWWPAVLPAVAITLAGWLAFGSPDADHLQFGADQARLLREATDIRNGTLPLVGAYSKNGPAHPGPLYTYLLGIVLVLSGDDIVRATSLLSLVQWSTAGVMVLAVHTATRSTLIAICSVLLTLVNPTFAFYARLIWNPSIVFPALAVALLAAVTIAQRRPWALPLLCLAVSVVVQAHVAAAAVAAVLLAWGAVWVVAHHGEVPRRVLLVSLLVLVVAWTPPLVEAIGNDGGNLAAWAALTRTNAGWHGWRDVWGTFARLAAESTSLPPFLFLAVVASSTLGLFLARTPHGLRAAALIAALALATLGVSIASVPGAIEIHYLRYAFVLFTFTSALAWAMLVDVASGVRCGQLATVALLVTLTGWGLWQRPVPVVRDALASPALTEYPLSDVGRFAAVVRHGVTSPRLATDITFVAHLAARQTAEPCAFRTDAEIAFAVGQAVALLQGCVAARPNSQADYFIARNTAAHPPAHALIHRGRALSLYYKPPLR